MTNDRGTLAEDAVEVIGLESESDGEHLEQRVGNGCHPFEVLGHVRPESRADVVGEPLVRSVETEVGGFEIEAAHGMLGRQVELFAQVGQPARQFGPDAFPAAEVRRQRLVDGGLGRLGQREESALMLDVPLR